MPTGVRVLCASERGANKNARAANVSVTVKTVLRTPTRLVPLMSHAPLGVSFVLLYGQDGICQELPRGSGYWLPYINESGQLFRRFHVAASLLTGRSPASLAYPDKRFSSAR